MRVGLDRAQIVDRDHLDIVDAPLVERAEHQAADAAEPVDANPNSHDVLRLEIDLREQPAGGSRSRAPPSPLETPPPPAREPFGGSGAISDAGLPPAPRSQTRHSPS